MGKGQALDGSTRQSMTSTPFYSHSAPSLRIIFRFYPSAVALGGARDWSHKGQHKEMGERILVDWHGVGGTRKTGNMRVSREALQ